MFRRSSVTVAMILGILGAFSILGTALAEGGFSSNFQAVYAGFESRSWEDKKLDAADTTISFSGCSLQFGATFTTVDVRLSREIPVLPDEDRGVRTLYCATTDTGYWGAQPDPGNFHFTIVDYAGSQTGTPLDASGVSVGY